MNVRTITSFILTVALIVSAAGVCAAEQSAAGVRAAEQSGQDGRYPYVGPDTPIMTTA